MKQKTVLPEGFNQWTIPWATPEGPEFDALRAGRLIPPEFHIDGEQIDKYQRDGVLFLPGAFNDWVEPLRAGFERNLANPTHYRFPAESTYDHEPGRFFDSYCNWPLIPEYREFVFFSAAASLAGQAMQSNYAQFFHEHAFMKDVGTQRATPWHQDIPYYCVSGDRNVSVYIALDEVDQDVSVHYVRGSHKWDKIFYPKVWLDGEDFNVDKEGYSETVPDIDLAPEKYDLVSWPLKPGDTVLFHFKTLHGTSDGIIQTRRRAFSTRWMGDDIRYLDRPGETSPPYVNPGMRSGDRMREDWFPILWRSGG